MAVNETILNATNATVNSSAAVASDPTVMTLLLDIASRFFVFLSAPFIYLDMWWLLVHLVLTFILFEFYFERHEGENLGWSAALANSIVAIFISLELLRSIYGYGDHPFSVFMQIISDFLTVGLTQKTVLVFVVLILLGLGIFTAVVNYFHLLPKSLAFLISGHKTINLLAYFSMVAVWRYTHEKPLPIDSVTLIALFLFGGMLWLLLFMLNHRMKRKKLSKHKFKIFD